MAIRQCSVALAALIGITGAAQDNPNFSGRWVLEAPASAVSTAATELRVSQWLAEWPFEVITIERQLPSGARSERYQIGLAGGVVGGVDAQGRGSGPSGVALSS